MIELHAPEIRKQRAEPEFRLAREADEDRRPERDVGHKVPQRLGRDERGVDRLLAVHLRQHLGNGMLKRDVHVTDRMLRRHHPYDEILGDLARIAVQHPHPEIARNPVDRPQKIREFPPLFAASFASRLRLLLPPQHRVLGNDVEFAAAARDQRTRLAENRLHRTRAVLAADRRDGAVGAAVGAAFGDLEIGEGLPGETQRGNLRLDPFPGHSAPLVDARELRERVRITLRIASRHNDPSVLSAALELERPQDLGLRLLARGRDERAGVDDRDVRPVGIRRERRARLDEIARHDLEVHGVLRASE